MIEMIYASAAAEELDRVALLRLLEQARERNAAVDITGMLIYDEGSFLQVIEGPEPAVEALWAKLEADKRHTDIVLLHKGAIEERSFGHWRMGFVDAYLRHEGLPGFSDFFSPKFDFTEPGGIGQLAKRVLLRFRDHGYRRAG